RRTPSGVLGRIRGALGREVHRPVGAQATAMYLASQIGPGRVIRLANRRLTS
ncbi:alcohol dehydrogenase, partial [Dietzia sp. SLG310A2-38A2]|nr:alcohol dehydrogenase [Dietzia sp. SLG310A2-38A2]